MLLAGEPAPPAAPLTLRAGPLALEFLDGGLRYVMFEDMEVLRRVHGAVRDRNWGTVAGTCEVLEQAVEPDRFTIAFERSHRAGDVAFDWRGTIAGNADGTLRFSFDGVARSTFLRNRIGLVVLHPLACAGARCRARYTNGTSFETTFPHMVSAEQPVVALHDLRALAHEVLPGLWAEVEFEGDEFETEDQRNWIDASFKTYSTPLRVPFPMLVERGTRVAQAISLRLTGTPVHAAGRRSPVTGAPRVIRLQQGGGVTIPRLGLGSASHGEPLRGVEIERLRSLGLAHLRIDVDLDSPRWADTLQRAAADAIALGTALEIAVTASAGGASRLEDLAAHARGHRLRVERWLVFGAGAASTPAGLLARARAVLGTIGAPIAGGTDADYYQLNQHRPDASAVDAVTFSMNPQVHAFDAASLVETIAAIPQTVGGAGACFPGLPVIVSPITLRPRFNPVATGDEADAPGEELPASVDPRQLSLLGAAWTLGALVALADGGAASVTLYETTGWKGVMERLEESPRRDPFPSVPGAVFPMYHVLADVAEFAGGALQPLQADHPQGRPSVCGCVLTSGGRRRLLVANLTPGEQLVDWPGAAVEGKLRRLALANVEHAMREPERYREVSDAAAAHSGVKLGPYEYVCIDEG
jgi:hypothetical protein